MADGLAEAAFRDTPPIQLAGIFGKSSRRGSLEAEQDK
jgi:hypothetical protein